MELNVWKGKLESVLGFVQKWKYVWIILLIGLLMMMTGGDEKKEERTENGLDAAFSVQDFEQRLSDCLEKIDGIGKIELMLSLDSSERTEYASDIRRTATESYESEVSTVSNGNYGEQPVKVTTICPEFRGAVVICEGADDDRVRLAVTEAVGALCDLGADRIVVIKMGQ